MLKQTVLFLLLGGLLAGCATSRDGIPDDEKMELRQSMAPSRLYKVGNVTYAVSQRPEARTGIRVRTRGGVSGSKKGAYTAARRAYGCQSMSLTESVPVWRVAEGHGNFCQFDRAGGVAR